MSAMIIRWYRSRRNHVIALVIIILCLIYYFCLNENLYREPDLDVTRSVNSTMLAANLTSKPVEALNITSRYIEGKLQEALKQDKGTGCEFPQLDPFAREVTQFAHDAPNIKCEGQDWVRCYLSECRVVDDVLINTNDIECQYIDILYESDNKYTLGDPTVVRNDDVYVLKRSDHVKVKCSGKIDNIVPSKWTGHAIGFRNSVHRNLPPPGREESLDVLIFGFDSTSKNGFIRKMPKTYEFITKELGMTVLNGYNIVGDGTPAALFPILTGKTELELPDVRKKSNYEGSLDDMPFIFYKLKEDGYRTAYFEDMPWIGTFQYRFKGFKRQPADHYLRPFFLEESGNGKKWWKSKTQRYCVGDTLSYKLMMNITDQFLKLDGKHFAFTFVADITHDDFNMISIADEDTVNFLKALRDSGHLEKTLLFIMGDHGARYSNVRNTLQGKFEERMPLMSIRLPEVLLRSRPEVAAILENNSLALTTPHDIHATVLDAMGLGRYWNEYMIEGADVKRGLSLFQNIPRNRSCSEAGIEPHWCSCVAWQPVAQTDQLYKKTADAFVKYINSLTQSVRSKCVVRTLGSIEWVSRRKVNSKMLAFVSNKDPDGYIGKFSKNYDVNKENYQVKVSVGPGNGIYEASAVFLKDENKFIFDTRDISRTNAYNDEPSCISATHPHLNMYCYCKGYQA